MRTCVIGQAAEDGVALDAAVEQVAHVGPGERRSRPHHGVGKLWGTGNGAVEALTLAALGDEAHGAVVGHLEDRRR